MGIHGDFSLKTNLSMQLGYWAVPGTGFPLSCLLSWEGMWMKVFHSEDHSLQIIDGV